MKNRASGSKQRVVKVNVFNTRWFVEIERTVIERCIMAVDAPDEFGAHASALILNGKSYENHYSSGSAWRVRGVGRLPEEARKNTINKFALAE